MLNAVIRRLGRLRGEAHTAVAVNVGEPGAHTSVVSVSVPARKEGAGMTDEPNELDEEELARQNGEPLPERTQMSLIYPGPGGPVAGPIDVVPNDVDPTPGPVQD